MQYNTAKKLIADRAALSTDEISLVESVPPDLASSNEFVLTVVNAAIGFHAGSLGSTDNVVGEELVDVGGEQMKCSIQTIADCAPLRSALDVSDEAYMLALQAREFTGGSLGEGKSNSRFFFGHGGKNPHISYRIISRLVHRTPTAALCRRLAPWR